MQKEVIETFDYLKKIDCPVFVDGTFGLGGHSLALFQAIDGKLKIYGFDKDIQALDEAKNKISAETLNHIQLIQNDFKKASADLLSLGIEEIDGALLDLGVSSLQLNSDTRGFSFKNSEAPLDMRMNKYDEIDAAYLLNNYPKERLAFILKEYGEEKFAKNIAKNIAKIRTEKKIEKVGELLEIIGNSVPEKYKHSKIHFATRTFQALRIEVNQELTGLNQGIADFVNLLKPGAKIAIISFHSLEDRIVKNTFKELAAGCICPRQVPVCQCNLVPKVKILTKKPVTPGEDEVSVNPRSRSAKLRIAEKL
jgi:16S rRNA (cytosine1402-N4)-methyltransferase